MTLYFLKIQNHINKLILKIYLNHELFRDTRFTNKAVTLLYLFMNTKLYGKAVLLSIRDTIVSISVFMMLIFVVDRRAGNWTHGSIRTHDMRSHLTGGGLLYMGRYIYI